MCSQKLSHRVGCRLSNLLKIFFDIIDKLIINDTCVKIPVLDKKCI